jgi:molybdopterin-dependent oxidoreductase alpha subunit
VPPEELSALATEPAPSVAAGLPAVMSALKHVAEESGIRGLQSLLKMNQTDGFDCPGCAWPDPDGERSANEYCENGAKAIAEEASSALVTPDFFATYSVQELAEWSDYRIGKAGRITHPMVLRAGSSHYEPLAWDEAFALIADELNALDTPDEAAFYTSGRTSNEAAFLYQLFVRMFGTNNLPDCSNMCHESSGKALKEQIGIGKGTVLLEDFDHAEVIFVIGQNPGTNHPRMLTALQRAKRRGAKIVNINPLPEVGLQAFKHPQEFWTWLGSGTKLADVFLHVRINGDIAAMKGIMKYVLEVDAIDRDFLRQHTRGFEAFAADIATTSWEEIEEGSGLRRDDIRQAAEIVARSKRIITCWAMGLTQHKNAVETIQTVVNMLLVRGAIGRTGAGVCPVRGHSNVQGDRTMGIWEAPSQAFLDALGKEFDFTPPTQHGLDVVHTIKAMHEGCVKVLVALGGNFLSATPDTAFTAAALERCRLTVQISTKLNRSHLVTGRTALILPCLGRTDRDVQASGEQSITVEDSMSMVHLSKGHLKPPSEHLLSEPAIVARLAAATFLQHPAHHAARRVEWMRLAGNYDLIRERIARVIPGFQDFNRRVRERKQGFYLGNSARELDFTTALGGKANFVVAPIPAHHLTPEQFLLMTIRTHDQFNTTIYGMNDRYRGIHNERRVVLMNPEDMKQCGFRERDVVDITSHFQTETRTAARFLVVPYMIPRRCLAAYFPETNVLVPIDSVADKSHTPTSKSIVVSLAPHQPQPA